MENANRIWKKITYPGVTPNMYMISDDGYVMSGITLEIMKTFSDKDGYKRIALRSINKGYSTISVHRLVAWEFCKGRDKNLVVDHIDGNKINNHYTNLEWVTAEENSHRARKNGLYITGEDSMLNIYDKSFVIHVCELYEAGFSTHDVFKMFTPKFADIHGYNKLYQFLRHLRLKNNWRDICEKYSYSTEDEVNISEKMIEMSPDRERSTISEELIREICTYLEDDLPTTEIIMLIMKERYYQHNEENTKEINKLRKLINRIANGECWFTISCEYDLPKAEKSLNYQKAKRLCRLYNECDFYIKNMIDNNYSREEIYKAYGILDDENPIKPKVDMMIDNYIAFSKYNNDMK